MECNDFLEFQDKLKKMRILDDKIVHALNVKIPTHSFRNEIDPHQTCKEFYDELQTNYNEREKYINKCIDITSNRIKGLKEKRDSPADASAQKFISKEQTKLRLLKSELLVEEVVRGSSLKYYSEKCREFYKPQNAQSLF